MTAFFSFSSLSRVLCFIDFFYTLWLNKEDVFINQSAQRRQGGWRLRAVNWEKQARLRFTNESTADDCVCARAACMRVCASVNAITDGGGLVPLFMGLFFVGNFRLDFCRLPVSFSFFHSWSALTCEVFWQILWSLYEPKPFVGMLICTQQECFLTFGEHDPKAGAPPWHYSASFVIVCCDTFCLYHKIAAPHYRFGYCTWPYWD